MQAFVALGALAAALHARGFRVGFVGDDYTLLDAALRLPPIELLSGRHGILGYYRPVSRELYFWWWGHVCHLGPIGYHVVNAITYAATVTMFALFLRRWLGTRVAVTAATVFVLFPPAGALTSWISCAQDLIALFWSAAALLLRQRGRRTAAGIAVALAVLSKETAVIVPFVIAAYDWGTGGAIPWRDRLKRLAPVFAGLGVAVAIAVAVRLGWPAGTSVAVWSPRQMAGAWQLPLDFARTLWPPGTVSGAFLALRAQPAVLVLVAGFAALSIPRATPGSKPALPAASEGVASSASPVVAARSSAAFPLRAAIVFALVLTVLGMLPVGVILDRWRGYFFSFAALGSSLLLALALVRIPSVAARLLVAAAAVASYGANSHYQPVEAAWAPARHPHVNHTFFRETAELSDRLLESLRPWCSDFSRPDHRTFTVGVPRQTTFDNVLGPALRVSCRDTAARVRPLEEFTTADAAGEFELLRYDPASESFSLQRSDARGRIALGEGFLLFRRYDVAAACFAVARTDLPRNGVLSYLHSASTAALAGPRAGNASLPNVELAPDSLATALLARASAVRSETDRATTRRLAVAVIAAPADAVAHQALGRHLIGIGNPRQGAIELSLAYGLTRTAGELDELAHAYETLGAIEEARAAYALAIAAGLPEPRRIEAERRRQALEGLISGAGAGAPISRSEP